MSLKNTETFLQALAETAKILKTESVRKMLGTGQNWPKPPELLKIFVQVFLKFMFFQSEFLCRPQKLACHGSVGCFSLAIGKFETFGGNVNHGYILFEL